jgi:hypothetical protein
VLALAALAAGGVQARGLVSPAEQPPLVSMHRLNGQIFETVAVQQDGSGEVGLFIGEVTSIRYHAFTLDPGRMATLRRLVSDTHSLRRQIYLSTSVTSRPFVVDTEYIIAIGPRSLVTDSSHAPRALKKLAAYLSALINHYSRSVSDHRPGG